MKNQVRLLFLFTLLIIALNMSCNAQMPTELASSIPFTTKTKTVTLSPVPAIHVTNTSTPLPPLPTLSPEDAKNKIHELMITNGGCRLPCWWGIVPGEAHYPEVSFQLNEFLITSKEFLGLSGSGVARFNNIEVYTYFYPDEGPFEGAYGQVSLFTDNDLVVAISLDGYKEISLGYSIQDILVNYGIPEEIWVYTLRDSYGEDVLPFVIVLDYSNLGFIAYYKGNGQPVHEKGTNLLCYEELENPPALMLWDPLVENPMASDDGNNLYRIWSELKPLEVATEMTKEEFFNQINQTNPNHEKLCLDTPSDLWDY